MPSSHSRRRSRVRTTASALAAFLMGSTLPSTAQGAVFNTPIEHVVLLMQENRAFDHMLGFLPGVNGLTGNESNPLNTSEPDGPRMYVNRSSPYVGSFDPDHGEPATTSKIYGKACLQANCTTPSMSGFAEFETHKHGIAVSPEVMNMFTPDRVPVMSTLAQEFGVFDRFFCSVPGPTWPNRLFQLMGTSQGDTKTREFNPNTTLYAGRTVFDIVEEAGHDWRFYYADVPLEVAMVEKLTFHPGKLRDWRAFKHDIADGNLPAFSWVNPRWFVNKTTNEGAADQHPDHDVRQGEALFKEVYEELRASPKWNSTLFIITYDEHGGYYDHVPPPQEGVPAPDDERSYPFDFNFDRLGIRIPTLLISPWIPKGTVISAPTAAQKPTPTSEFDLTSIISTVRKMFGGNGGEAVEPLTRRDAWAATFEDQLALLSEPRTDCPMTLPDAPKDLGAEGAAREAAQPLNDLQVDIVNAFEALRRKTGVESVKSYPVLQGDAAEWAAPLVRDILAHNKRRYEDRATVDPATDVGLYGNCKKDSYAFCCEVGTPCDCTKGTTAPDQCKPESYGFCCSIGTPCDCTQPPLSAD